MNVGLRLNLLKERPFGLKGYFLSLLKNRLSFNEFWVLRDVDISIRRGEIVGIVGLNGSGKSTLLKIISGIIKPTKGSISVHGKISPLIELGAGFDSELTARENIYLNGSMLGYTRRFITSIFDDIIDFAEIDKFIDVPIKNFSSGMVARVGFAVATAKEPDILLVDEILSVGDFKFQQKCEDRIQKMINDSTTVLIVSHDIDRIKHICHKVIWIDNRTIKMFGDTSIVCNSYMEN